MQTDLIRNASAPCGARIATTKACHSSAEALPRRRYLNTGKTREKVGKMCLVGYPAGYMKAYWTLIRKDDPSAAPIVLNSFPVTLGRSRKSDIKINDKLASSRHVVFEYSEDHLIITDLNTTNGSELDGRFFQSVKLKTETGARYNLKIADTPFALVYGRLGEALEIARQPQSAPSEEEDIDRTWFFKHEDQTHGPITPDELVIYADQGLLRPDDEVWSSKMTFSVKAFEIKGLYGESSAKNDDFEMGESEAVEFEAGESEAGSAVCPYCWRRFAPEEVLFIATHPELLGDDVAGETEMLRFLPTRFTPAGHAIDRNGCVCTDTACPFCHMRLPTALTDHPPLFLSLVGAPGSGKSYYLTSSIWTLREVLPRFFGLRFIDVDAVTNQWLNDYEAKLFFQRDSSAMQAIVKTDLDADHVSKSITLDGVSMRVPLPSMFVLQSADAGTEDPTGEEVARTMVLYDNAGEHFNIGEDTIQQPGTKHLTCAEGIIFLFDPVADPRFLPLFKEDPFANEQHKEVKRQDVILVEMISRIRKHLGLSSRKRYEKPLILAVSKADLIAHKIEFPTSPWKFAHKQKSYLLDIEAIADASFSMRSLLMGRAPEIVRTVESFAELVLYLPVSALGHNPTPPKAGVRPCDIKPKWVETPWLYILNRLGFLPAVRPEHKPECQEGAKARNGVIHVSVPGTNIQHDVPEIYSGFSLHCPESGRLFQVPCLTPEFKI